MTEQEFKNADAYFVCLHSNKNYVHNNGESFFLLNSYIDAHVVTKDEASQYIKADVDNTYNTQHVSEVMPSDINIRNLYFTK